MTDFAPYQKLEFLFAEMLTDLSKNWPMADIAYIRDIVSHAEYGEALENLVAMGADNDRVFTAGQTLRLHSMCQLMGLDTSVLQVSARSAA